MLSSASTPVTEIFNKGRDFAQFVVQNIHSAFIDERTYVRRIVHTGITAPTTKAVCFVGQFFFPTSRRVNSEAYGGTSDTSDDISHPCYVPKLSRCAVPEPIFNQVEFIDSDSIDNFLPNARSILQSRSVETTHEDLSFADSLLTLDDSKSEFFHSISDLFNTLDVNESQLRELEQLALTITGLIFSDSLTTSLIHVSMYIHTHMKSSMSSKVNAFLSEMYNSYDRQSGDDWENTIKNGLVDLRSIGGNPIIYQLSKIAGLCVSVGLCNIADVEFKIGNFKAFTPVLTKKFASAPDLIDATLGLISDVIEICFKCYKNSTLKPLIYGSNELNDIMLDTVECDKHVKLWELGRYEESGLSLNDIIALIDKTEDRLKRLYKSIENPSTQTVIMRKIDRLQTIHQDCCRMQTSGELRAAPFTVTFFGNSSVGKSSLVKLVQLISDKAAGRNFDQNRVSIIQSNDKFMSGYRAGTLHAWIDDHMNTNLQFVDGDPNDLLIKCNNNVPTYAPKADVDEKGSVPINPETLCITTNAETFMAEMTSNCPLAIMRRAGVHITVKVKQEYRLKRAGIMTKMLDQDKVLNDFPGDNMPDVWLFTVRYPASSDDKGKRFKLVIETWNGKKLEDINVTDLCQYLVKMLELHKQNQAFLLKNAKQNTIPYCNDCNNMMQYCECVSDEHDENWNKQAGILETLAIVNSTYHKVVFWYDTLAWIRWTNWIPRSWFDNPTVADLAYRDQQVNPFSMLRKIKVFFIIHFSYRILMAHFTFLFLTVYVFALFPGIICVFVLWLLWLLFSIHVTLVSFQHYSIECMRSENSDTNLIYRGVRDDWKYAAYGICGLATLVSVIKCYRNSRNNKRDKREKKEQQGGAISYNTTIDPKTSLDIKSRDSQCSKINTLAEEYGWKNPALGISYLGTNECSRTTTHEDLCANAFNNLVSISYGKHKVCGLFINDNYAILPKHTFDTLKNDMVATFVRSDKRNCSFRDWLSLKHCEPIVDNDREVDLVVAYFASAGSWRDILKYLPLEKCKDHKASFIHKTIEGQLYSCRVNCKEHDTYEEPYNYVGYKYDLDVPTRHGMCGSVLVSEGKYNCITGMHLLGVTGKCSGFAEYLNFKSVSDAYRKLEIRIGRIKNANISLPSTSLGQELELEPTLHYKSPINVLDGGYFQYHGATSGRSTFYSTVHTHKIIRDVEELFNIKCNYGPPNVAEYNPQMVYMQHMAVPTLGPSPTLLEKAVESYSTKLFEKMDDMLSSIGGIRPLTREETLNGIPGKKFVDSMNFSTSVGFPGSGPKTKFTIDYIGKDGYPKKDFVPEIWNEFEECKAIMLKGERPGMIFKSVIKDEALPMDKPKARVFNSGSLMLTIFGRMYFLPIIRLLCSYPLTSECAVGINCYNNEWEELMSYLEKHGSDNIIAGDFSKYDVSLPASVISAYLGILMQVAEYSKSYSEEDLKIMRILCTEVTYPLIAFFGDLISVVGMNPSGSFLTVIENGGCGSLLLRCAFFDIYPEAKISDFNDYTSLITYGDDSSCGVSDKYPLFNHLEVAKYLKTIGMKFTPPDKSDEACEYIAMTMMSFLKRQSVYHEALGCRVGALAIESILKMLMVGTKSELSEQEQIAVNLDTANREFFFHGKDKYIEYNAKLCKIAEKHNLMNWCETLKMSYEDHVDMWLKRYTDVSEENEESEKMERQAGESIDIINTRTYHRFIRMIDREGLYTSEYYPFSRDWQTNFRRILSECFEGIGYIDDTKLWAIDYIMCYQFNDNITHTLILYVLYPESIAVRRVQFDNNYVVLYPIDINFADNLLYDLCWPDDVITYIAQNEQILLQNSEVGYTSDETGSLEPLAD